MFNMAQCNCLLDKTKFYDSKETRTMQSCKLKCCKIISAAKIQLVALRNQANVAMIKYLALFSFNQKNCHIKHNLGMIDVVVILDFRKFPNLLGHILMFNIYTSIFQYNDSLA